MDNRLLFISGLVSKGCRVADIGTDHAYLPIYLMANSICTKVIATDIRKKPLAVAKVNIETHNAKNIDLRLCDGLQDISPEEVDEIVIAGMGGEVISEIINNARWLKNSYYKLILQPMSHSEDLRKYLCDNGFFIKNERAVESENRIYTVIEARYCGEKIEYNDLFLYIGKLQENCGIDDIKYIKWRRKVLFERAEKIKNVAIKQDEYSFLAKIISEIDKVLGAV